jgi:hypothetical protein
MDVRRKTFMLLPQFDFPIGGEIQLGTFLSLSKETKLPDPDFPLNDKTRITPDEKDVKRQMFNDWSTQLVSGKIVSPSLEAEVPLFAPVNGGLGYKWTSDQNLVIQGDLATERFPVMTTYLVKSLQDEWVQKYCKKTVWPRPSVYLVSGRMLIRNAKVEAAEARDHSGNLRIGVDASAAGIPVKVGPGIEAGKQSEAKIGGRPQMDFILAYQLTRVKMKGDASVKGHETYTKHALWDDNGRAEDIVSTDTLERYWEFEVVDEATEHDSNHVPSKTVVDML